MKQSPLGKHQHHIIQWLNEADDSEEWFTIAQIKKGTGIAKQTIERTILPLVERGIVAETYAENHAVYQIKEVTV